MQRKSLQHGLSNKFCHAEFCIYAIYLEQPQLLTESMCRKKLYVKHFQQNIKKTNFEQEHYPSS